MSAARLDPFSARLHAIHRRGAKAKPPKPTLQEESAPKGATTGMPGSMSHVPVNGEGQGSMSYVPVDDEGQGSMSYVPVDDDDEPPRPGHSASNIPRDYSHICFDAHNNLPKMRPPRLSRMVVARINSLNIANLHLSPQWFTHNSPARVNTRVALKIFVYRSRSYIFYG